MALDPLTAGLDLAKTVVDKIWPDKSEQERAQLAAALQLVHGQIDINKAEAASPSVFTSVREGEGGRVKFAAAIMLIFIFTLFGLLAVSAFAAEAYEAGLREARAECRRPTT